MMWTFSLAKFGLSIVGKSPLSDKMKHYFFNAISISSSMIYLRGHWQNNRNRSQMTGIQRCYSESMTATIPYKKYFYHHISCFSHVIRQWRKLVKRTSTERCKLEIIRAIVFDKIRTSPTSKSHAMGANLSPQLSRSWQRFRTCYSAKLIYWGSWRTTFFQRLSGLQRGRHQFELVDDF